MVGLLELTFLLTAAMFSLSVAVASFDIVVVWFGVWIPLRRATSPEDRPFLWKGIAGYAKAAREQHEFEQRMKHGSR